MTQEQELARASLKRLVRGVYDLQKLRIQKGLRIVSHFGKKLGVEPGESPEETDEDSPNPKAAEVWKALKASHARITDAIVAVRGKSKHFVGDGLISDEAELELINSYNVILKEELHEFDVIEAVLEKGQFAIYPWLKGIKGVGRALAGFLIAEIDIEKSRYPSSLWKFFGLDVGPDGRGRGLYQNHLVPKSTVLKQGPNKGKTKTWDAASFDPERKAKLVGVLVPCLLRAKNETYTKVYADYKHRLEHHAVHSEKTPGHRHAMALRYTAKWFLADLYTAWRTAEGLPLNKWYAEDRLGRTHGGERAEDVA